MTRMLLTTAALFVFAFSAFAGPNAGGTIIAHDAGLRMSATDGAVPVCGQGIVPPLCMDADVEIDGTDPADPSVFVIYAAFYCGASPRVMGVTWGVNYDAANIILASFGQCGDFELNDNDWPAPGTGSTVTWNTVQTTNLFPIYWFSAYTYGQPGVLQLTPNPGQGGYFGDDSIPAILDPISDYGSMGFDMPGELACVATTCIGACCDPETGLCEETICEQCPAPRTWICGVPCDPNPCGPQPIAVCCDPATGDCTLLPEADCTGIWHQEWTSCDPNPCMPVPTEHDTWGRIKENYRGAAR